MKSSIMMMAVAVACSAGCGATVRSATSPDVNLAQFRTYQFHADPAKQGQAESLIDQDIQASLRQNLAMRGFTEVANQRPDFLVAFHTKTRQETQVVGGGPYAYGYGYGAVGLGPDIETYTEGTLLVDFIDPKTNKVFWRGTASQAIDNPGAPDAGKIDKAVSKLMTKYPATMASVPREQM